MNITQIKFRQLSNDGKLKAIVSIILDNVLAVHDIKVIQGSESLFVSMPSRRLPTGEYKNIIHPINQETRDYFENTILDAYYKILENPEEFPDAPNQNT